MGTEGTSVLSSGSSWPEIILSCGSSCLSSLYALILFLTVVFLFCFALSSMFSCLIFLMLTLIFVLLFLKFYSNISIM